ncbi:MAG: UbiD family decarboxylase, partial [Anaerolineae bacterium]|nr:UbiD family decarboxylase [Anaerolineae bacterium]
MDARTFIAKLDEASELQHITAAVSPAFEVARLIAQRDGQPVLCENLTGFPGWRLASGYVAQRAHFGRAIGCGIGELLARMNNAVAHPVSPPRMSEAPCQQVVIDDVDLTRIPIPRFHPLDGGPYITASVAVIY